MNDIKKQLTSIGDIKNLIPEEKKHAICFYTKTIL